jgi:imidazolonepropionase-like amidohydrolase
VPELPARFTLLTATRLLDGTGALPLDDAALLMEEGRVVRVGPRREVRAPDGAPVRVVDYGDAAILPGLVDAHTHLAAAGDGTPGDEVAGEDDAILLLQAAKNTRTLLHSLPGRRPRRARRAVTAGR